MFRFALLTLLALATPAAIAQTQLENNSERILIGIPEGFVLGHHDSDTASEIFEYIPEGETVYDWSQMFTVMEMGPIARVSPGYFLQMLEQQAPQKCPGSTGQDFSESSISGFAAARMRIDCPLNPETQKPETFLVIAISTNKSFYMVQYAWRSVPDDTAIAAGFDFINQVSLCDLKNAALPCPAD